MLESGSRLGRGSVPCISSTCSGSLVSGDTSLSASGSPKSWEKRCLAHTMQWMGWEGVLRMVQPGKVLVAGGGVHS